MVVRVDIDGTHIISMSCHVVDLTASVFVFLHRCGPRRYTNVDPTNTPMWGIVGLADTPMWVPQIHPCGAPTDNTNVGSRNTPMWGIVGPTDITNVGCANTPMWGVQIPECRLLYSVHQQVNSMYVA